MQQIPINAIPNQSLSIQIGDDLFDITLRTTNEVTSVSIAINNVQVIQNVRAVAGKKIIPSEYEESGNFIFIGSTFDLPYYTNFGVTQTLVYASAEELAAIRVPDALPITAADFSPIAALPLRFAPQGY